MNTMTAMTPDLFRAYARYNAWMNGNIYRGCEQIPDADRKKDLGAFFKSIHGTLNHIVWGDRAWIARFTGAAMPSAPADGIIYGDFTSLQAARQDLDAEIMRFAAGLTTDWLEKPFTFSSSIYKRTFTHPTWLLVLQLFNHQTHHRGQVTTLMKQLGVDPGPTDLPVMEIL